MKHIEDNYFNQY